MPNLCERAGKIAGQAGERADLGGKGAVNLAAGNAPRPAAAPGNHGGIAPTISAG